MADFQRNTAKICKIKELINGNFIQKEGWEPSYIITEYDKISRVNIVGVVVSKESATSCIVDDGSAKVVVRSFTSEISADVGQIVRVIGKPRLFNKELFINAEIIKIIKNKKWVDYRKKELSLRTKKDFNEPEFSVEDIKEKEEVKPDKEIKKNEVIKKNVSNAEIIINLIEKLDSADGADFEEVIKKSKIDNAEELIKNLMEEGEIFQIKPGKLKVM